MSKERPPEPLDFFIWTVEDVGLWLEEINLGSYRQIFKDNGVNGEYLEGMSMFTTEQILRFIRRCHMKWGDFITLCKELRRIKDFWNMVSGLPKRRAKGSPTMVGSVLPLRDLCQGCKAQQTVTSCFLEAGTMKQDVICICIFRLISGAEYNDECRIKETTVTGSSPYVFVVRLLV
ncbi:hypothetical protein NC652_033762 [Populus alba x Populus x berolinensis]|nr:hypothetical protein NC652_033762 [Populus alba x Populus x berolinensis]